MRAKHGVAERIEFVESDLFAERAGRRSDFDFIVSNPPYVSTAEMAELPTGRARSRAARRAARGRAGARTSSRR